jgi:ATP synthase protein I
VSGDPDRNPDKPRLEDIDARLKAIRGRRKAVERRSQQGARWQGAEYAWRMVIDLTAGVAVGSAIGWGLDTAFGTRPLFLLVFVLLGFAAGVRVMLQSAKDLQRRNRAKADEAAADGKDTGADAPQDEER